MEEYRKLDRKERARKGRGKGEVRVGSSSGVVGEGALGRWGEGEGRRGCGWGMSIRRMLYLANILVESCSGLRSRLDGTGCEKNACSAVDRLRYRNFDRAVNN